MRKFTLIFFIALQSIVCVNAQSTISADSAYSQPLAEVLRDIETQFGVIIRCDAKMTEGQILKYAQWRIKPWSVEESLRGVLAPFDYTFVEEKGGYKVKQFEYARTNPEQGRQFLSYLETLYNDKTSWELRRAELQRAIPEALHLSPLPPRPESKVILTKPRSYDGYTVENFAIETLPGVYVCGSIYKPLNAKGKLPVILNPNGHFGGGRYREDQQKRCATQARMGAISASWDLFAWGESTLQFSGELHRMSAAQIIQTLNTIRILDYLLSLKDADNSRVAITGGSGGGSMTMVMAAIDPRITLSVPVVMLSSYFVGGCPCESGMPVHLCANRTNNAEIAAMFAPKPQLVISDGADWTANVPQIEFPFLRRTYGFYGAENSVENLHLPAEGHDYGTSKRDAMYSFVAKYFDMDIAKIDESKVTIEKESIMKTFGEKGERLPANAIKGKEELLNILKLSNL